MKIVACIDDKKGMLFNNRRQSRDRVLIENLEKHLDGREIYISPYSKALFEKSAINYRVVENPINEAGQGYCFIENTPLPTEAQEIIIYHWNRHYPADTYFTIDISSYSKTSCEEFVGSSHEKITKEVYVK
ncbi:MAG: ribonuclease Z [Clostridia bacterium]|nr:ribonuclease Z [Clostridia bacterium]